MCLLLQHGSSAGRNPILVKLPVVRLSCSTTCGTSWPPLAAAAMPRVRVWRTLKDTINPLLPIAFKMPNDTPRALNLDFPWPGNACNLVRR